MLYELRLRCRDRAVKDALLRRMTGLGVPRSSVVEACDKKGFCLSLFEEKREEAELRRAALRAALPAGASLSLKALRAADWQTKWKKDFKPFRITKDLRVVPLWCKDKVRPWRGKDILIDTSMAFGTGLHPTTRAMAGFIEATAGEAESFLDLGTGTGILSIIARRYGARHVGALDISPDAVATARRNFRLNGCRCDFLKAVDLHEFSADRQYDLVAANILTPVLIACHTRIVSLVRPGGWLAVSGIWKDDYRRFRSRFVTRALRTVSVKRDKGWIAVLYRRQELP